MKLLIASLVLISGSAFAQNYNRGTIPFEAGKGGEFYGRCAVICPAYQEKLSETANQKAYAKLYSRGHNVRGCDCLYGIGQTPGFEFPGIPFQTDGR